jgi:hypothetical protein
VAPSVEAQELPLEMRSVDVTVQLLEGHWEVLLALLSILTMNVITVVQTHSGMSLDIFDLPQASAHQDKLKMDVASN